MHVSFLLSILPNSFWRYYVEIFNKSGCNELVEKFGPWFSLDQNPRAQIFQRNQTDVTDVDSMVRLMRYGLCVARVWRFVFPEQTISNRCCSFWKLGGKRSLNLWDTLFLLRYNNFKEDPLSKCDGCDPPENGENAISARSDLNPANGTYPFGALKQRPHGGTDMKVFIFTSPFALTLLPIMHPEDLFWFAVSKNEFKRDVHWVWAIVCDSLQLTSYEMFREYGMVAVSGPTWDQVPPFQWSASPYKDLLHMGQPDVWRFKPIKVTWTP